MSNLSLRLPDSIHRHLKRAADVDGISINQFISLAVAEKLSALQTYDIIAERAKGGSRASFLQAMALIPQGPVATGDEPRPTRGKANKMLETADVATKSPVKRKRPVRPARVAD